MDDFLSCMRYFEGLFKLFENTMKVDEVQNSPINWELIDLKLN